jgi:HEPN domain-containing protein
MLYESDETPFAKPDKLAPEEARAEARKFFEDWYPSACDFFGQAQHAVANGRLKIAAFELHQAAERFYVCVLLTLTLYSPKSHKLNFLRSQAERLAPALIDAWPRNTREDRRRFELLRRAYVEARYSPAYTISAQDLDWLTSRVSRLQRVVEVTCRQTLASAVGERQAPPQAANGQGHR